MPFSGVFWPFPISSNPLLGIMLKMALQAKKAAVQILRHKREHQQLSSASISSIQTSVAGTFGNLVLQEVIPAPGMEPVALRVRFHRLLDHQVAVDPVIFLT